MIQNYYISHFYCLVYQEMFKENYYYNDFNHLCNYRCLIDGIITGEHMMADYLWFDDHWLSSNWRYGHLVMVVIG